ncbi:MAG: bifunctional rhamnulose-1-phosphate aldolase/short-chain dehydrogenase [SAR202 cluster bacterium]|nr:bifunctional rhamnulose-1-phosphate aldolase/short-chain dehydrogenase [SAR202 cluster bacterium]|tara:strand:- start:5818 stop:7869 length:2052 start_codon:yes stop_codon:yes gene_type:complete
MQNKWDEKQVRNASLLDQLVYQSKLIGSEEDLVLFGGGNTSIKRHIPDFRDMDVSALTVKGSGSDMQFASPENFSDLRLDDITPLLKRTRMADDEMITYLMHCLLNIEAPRPSIETLLHAFIPSASVVHTHADAILALTNNRLGSQAVLDALEPNTLFVPYKRPGFLNAKEVALLVQKHPDSKGLVLMNHGLLTWADSVQEAYENHIGLVSQAEDYLAWKKKGQTITVIEQIKPLSEQERHEIAHEISPFLRGLVSTNDHFLIQFDDSSKILDFTSMPDAPKISQKGPATPDHMLRTRRLPLWVPLNNGKKLQNTLKTRLDTYAEKYQRWFDKYKDESIAPLDPYPRVVLIPSVGMWTLGTTRTGTERTKKIYHHTVDIMQGAETIDRYKSLNAKDAFEIDHWPLELYKLTLAGPKQELEGRVAFITGAASGIGFAIAQRLAQEGATVAISDLDLSNIEEAATRINNKTGTQNAIGFPLDVTNEVQVKDTVEKLVLITGGIDILVSNAGIAPNAPIHSLDLADWEKSFAVNATGHFLAAREVVRVMQRQNIGGSLIFIGTKNIPAPGHSFGAYSAAKSAEAQLARILALEGGAFGIRSNIVNPDAIFQGSQLWSASLKQQRAETYGIKIDELERYYHERNILKKEITAEDVAETALFLASDRSSKTTGAMFPVDGGVAEAFPR